ncbi:hypothetical protein [Ekhidna sp.]|uniref:hypothetical protein n=1 Tax=Ekhidna sp. TaxID=2608089 RepID=UPI00329813FB
MMDMNQEDELLKGLFESSEVQPSSNITEKVMHRIDVNPKAFEYEPVISKKAWIVMGSAFAITMLYLLVNSSGVAIEAPIAFQVIKDGMIKFGTGFSFELQRPALPEIPSTLLISIAALNVIGIYLIAYIRWRKSMFR